MRLTQNEIKNLFEYRDGCLYKDNKKVGVLNKDGYLNVKIGKHFYLAHRLIFMMHHGYVPEILDHVNRDRLDNRIENLRECSRSQNATNAKLYCTNTSGVKNVTWHKSREKWQVRISIKKKEMFLGYFEDLELAELVAIEARAKYYKGFEGWH